MFYLSRIVYLGSHLSVKMMKNIFYHINFTHVPLGNGVLLKLSIYDSPIISIYLYIIIQSYLSIYLS